MAKLETHAIRMPGVVLDQIRSKQESGDYGQDLRFGKKRKRDEKRVSRKDKRKEERRLKKQKQQKPKQPKSKETRKPVPPAVKASVKPEPANESDPLAVLKALKAKNEKGSGENKKTEFRLVREDELDDELSDDFGDEETGDEEMADFGSEDFEDFEDFDDLADSDQGSEDPLAALKKLKEKKRADKVDLSDDEMLPEIPSDFEESENEFGEVGGESGDEFESGEDFEDDEELGGAFEIEEELEEEEDPLAKLKALKEAKNAASKLDKSKSDSGNDSKSEKSGEAKSKSSKPDEIEANFVDPFDNDLEYYAKKLGLKNGKKSKLSKIDDDDVVGGLLDGLDFASEFESVESEQSEYESDEERGPKENPFVAPGTEESAASAGGEKESKYIPPALRRKMALEGGEENAALQRSIKGPVNKLSEANVGSIVNEINGLFLNHARQAVNESLTSTVLQSIVQQGRLLDTFVYLHAVLVVAIYRLQGVDFGAYFIQTLIEKFEDARKRDANSKEALNLVSLLSSVYALQLVSSNLLYDLIRDLIEELSEANAEILLKIIRNSGNQMRSDDPGSLKEIVLQVSKKSSSLASTSPRMQFLVETISSLKNNKMNAANSDSHELMVRLKKFLGNFVSAKLADPLQVSLDDIRNVDTRGKWWLVGSAWKGNEAKPEALANVEAMNDILDSAEPNWLELAKLQRMNTDIRRAIFISIMSANDYVDAVTKLDKLALKKAQEREIPRIVVHCAVVEPAYNPYYGILASKLCDSHSHRKTFQFMLWDLVKSFEGAADDSEDEDFTGFDENLDDDDKLKKILNLGRLFGNLFAEGSLALHILRPVNFVTASADLKMFMEVIFVTFFDIVGKKSQVNSIGVGLGKRNMSEQKFDDRTLIEKILKAKDESAMLRGICHFINKSVIRSNFITGRKQRKRVEWGVNAMCDVTEEIVKEGEEV